MIGTLDTSFRPCLYLYESLLALTYISLLGVTLQCGGVAGVLAALTRCTPIRTVYGIWEEGRGSVSHPILVQSSLR